MPSAATVAVIRDLLAIAGIALAIGLVVYAVIRSRSDPQWNSDGNVLARPYGPPDAVAGLLLLALFFPFVSPEAVVAAPGGESSTPSAGSLVGGMLFYLLIALVPLGFLKIRGLEPSELFGIRQLSMRSTLRAGLAGFVVIYAVFIFFITFLLPGLLHGLVPDEKPQQPVEAFQNATGGLQRLLIAFAAVVIAPLAEETIFRGYLYGVTKRFTDRWFAAIFTSLVFACVHQHLGSTAPLFVLAMGFAVAYEFTGSLMVPMIMHAMFNGTNLFLLSLAEKS